MDLRAGDATRAGVWRGPAACNATCDASFDNPFIYATHVKEHMKLVRFFKTGGPKMLRMDERFRLEDIPVGSNNWL